MAHRPRVRGNVPLWNPTGSHKRSSVGCPSSRPFQEGSSCVRRILNATILISLLSLLAPAQGIWAAQNGQSDQTPTVDLKQLSLEQLGDVQVTTVSKDPQQVMKTP